MKEIKYFFKGRELEVESNYGIVVIKNFTEGTTLTLNKRMFTTLVSEGVITVKQEEVKDPVNNKEKNTISHDIRFYIKRIADKKGYSYKNVEDLLNLIYRINPVTKINILLKEIAVNFDSKYPGYISSCKELYVIDSSDFQVKMMPNTSNILTYRTAAYFRTYEDAHIALDMIRPIIEDIINNNKAN